MSNSLDNPIKAALLHNATPPTSHLERFAARLERQAQRMRTFRMVRDAVIGIAATLVLVVLLHRPTPPTADYVYSVQEVAAFYNRQLQDEAETVREKMSIVCDTTTQTELERNLAAMQQDFSTWADTIPNLTDDERIAWIVRRYHIEAESLRHIRNILETNL